MFVRRLILLVLPLLAWSVIAGDEPAKHPRYEEFHKAIDDDVSRWIIVSTGAAPVPETAKSKNPDAQRLYDEAAQSLSLGAHYGATKSLNEVIKLTPDWPEAWLLLGRARARTQSVPRRC